MCSDAQAASASTYLKNDIKFDPVTNVTTTVDTKPLGDAIKEALTTSAAINATAVVAVTEAVTKAQGAAITALSTKMESDNKTNLLLGVATIAVMLYASDIKKVLK